MTDEKKICYFFQEMEGLNRIFRTPVNADDHAFVVNSAQITPFNIVISGAPGTGKTTLAMSMIAGIRVKEYGKKKEKGQNVSVLYYSLEQSIDSIQERFKSVEPYTYCDSDFTSSLLKKNKQIKTVVNKNTIIFPKLSPLPIEKENDDSPQKNIFWRRYQEISELITLLRQSEKTDSQKLHVIVIDSLSMFSNVPLSRYMVNQLFQLFAENNLIGIFILDSRDENISHNNENANITAAADIVIELGWKIVNNYSFRTINMTKCRYSSNAYGDHLLKLSDKGCRIYPSLHSWHPLLNSYSTNMRINTPNEHYMDFLKFSKDENESLVLYEEKADNVIKHERNEDSSSQTTEYPNIVLFGQRHLRKNALAARYACQQIDNDDGKKEKFLVVSFGANAEFLHSTDKAAFKELKPLPELKYLIPSVKGSLSQIKACLDEDIKSETDEIKSKKVCRQGYLLKICPGFILPEELIWYLYRIINELSNNEDTKLNKMIFINMGSWEISYPLLYKNIMSGDDNFFPTLNQLLHWKKISCLFSCSVTNAKNPLLRNLSSISQLILHVRYCGISDAYYLEAQGSPVLGTSLSKCSVKHFEQKGWAGLELIKDVHEKAMCYEYLNKGKSFIF